MQLPIRSKIEIAEKIGRIIECLDKGQKQPLNRMIEEIKNLSIYLDETIQGDVLVFAESVQFQSATDPAHPMNHEIERAADQLIEDLGFHPPKFIHE